MMLEADAVLPIALSRELLLALCPLSPAESAAARVRERVMARIQGGARGAPVARAVLAAVENEAPAAAPRVCRADEGWKPLAAGADMKILSDDGASLIWLLRLAPGGRLPDHTHDEGEEECLLLEGEVSVNGVSYRSGDWQLARLGSRHRDVRSEGGCVLYLRSAANRGTCAHGSRRATNEGHCHA